MFDYIMRICFEFRDPGVVISCLRPAILEVSHISGSRGQNELIQWQIVWVHTLKKKKLVITY